MFAGGREFRETRHGQTQFASLRPGDLERGSHLLAVLLKSVALNFQFGIAVTRAVCRPTNSVSDRFRHRPGENHVVGQGYPQIYRSASFQFQLNRI